MKRFIYLITEGVLDVLLISQVLKRGFGFESVDQMDQLSDEAKQWMAKFKWPIQGDIKRRSVPVPEFLENETVFIGIANAQGLTEIKKKLAADIESFVRIENWMPEAVCIILDADDKPPQDRFDEFAAMIAEFKYPRPVKLDHVCRTGDRVSGVFALPGGGVEGTLEHLLDPLAKERFPSLHSHAEAYVDGWNQHEDCNGSDYREIRKPSGLLKARISAMASVLKPGKPLAATIEDHKWVPTDVTENEALKPLVEFLQALLASPVEGS